MKKYLLILLVASLPLCAAAQPTVFLDTTANYSDLDTAGRGQVGTFGTTEYGRLVRFSVDQAGTLEQIVWAVGVAGGPSTPYIGDADLALSKATISIAENTSSNEAGAIIGSLTGVSAAPISTAPETPGYEPHEFTFNGSVSLTAGDYWLILTSTGDDPEYTDVFWQYAGGSLAPIYGAGTWTLADGPNSVGFQVNGDTSYRDSMSTPYFYGQMLGTPAGGGSSASTPAVPVPILPLGGIWILIGLMGIVGARHLLKRA